MANNGDILMLEAPPSSRPACSTGVEVIDALPYIDDEYGDSFVKTEVELMVERDKSLSSKKPADFLNDLPPIPTFNFQKKRKTTDDAKIEKKQKLDGTEIKKKEKLEKEKEQGLWSQLHVDLCRRIMSKFCFMDQVRFLAVCKNWKAVDEYNKTPPSLPWVITIDTPQRFTIKLIYKIYEPSPNHMEPSVHKTLDFQQFGVTPYNPWSLQSNITCKYGWLFFSMQDRYIQPRLRFLLISPITKEFIELPQIKLSQTVNSKFLYPEFVKGFSTQPKSRDCVFFVLNDNASKAAITIKTFRKGEKGWTSRDFYNPPGYYVPCRACNFLYVDGILYIAFPDERVVSYDIAQRMFRVASYHNSLYNIPNFKISEVFELDGELLLININHNGSGSIRKFDRRSKVWRPLKNLGDRALFISSHSSWVLIGGNDERNYGVLPNNIYYLKMGQCRIYTLESDGDKLVERTDASAFTYCSRFNNLNGDLAFWLKHPGLHVLD